MIKHRGETAELQRLDQIPDGMTEEQVDGFWETHSLGDGILEQMEPFPDDFPLAPHLKISQRSFGHIDASHLPGSLRVLR